MTLRNGFENKKSQFMLIAIIIALKEFTIEMLTPIMHMINTHISTYIPSDPRKYDELVF